jgi:DNA adenine methylase
MMSEETKGKTTCLQGSGSMTRPLAAVVNVTSVTHRSPFRYPGGKTWLVPRIRQWLASLPSPPVEFVEPFAGGGIVGLSVIFDGLANRLTLIEKDPDVASVWRVMLNGKGKALADWIMEFHLTPESARAVLAASPANLFDRAFATIVRNRVQRGGILAPGASLMKLGENGRGVLSRWYPETLRQRILGVVGIKNKICFEQGDGIAFMEAHKSDKQIAWLIDPPYTVAGRRLYRHSVIDHDHLFALASQLRGDFLMTYDNAPPVQALAKRYKLDTQQVAMKNTHHAVMSELLIGKNLEWARG